jgi:hypothetical protein
LRIGREHVKEFFRSPDEQSPRVIQVECVDGSAAHRAQTDQEMASPAEVLVPLLGARVEKRHQDVRFRVERLKSIFFMQIARGTGQRQVFQFRAAAVCAGFDVFDVESRSLKRLMHAVVFAALAGAGDYLPHGLGPGSHAGFLPSR